MAATCVEPTKTDEDGGYRSARTVPGGSGDPPERWLRVSGIRGVKMAAVTTISALMGQSPGMVALRAQISRVLGRQAAAARRSPAILIQGETGTGKGLVATTIHRAGRSST